ncbi:MAG: NAD(P)-dependent oxidoreductase [Rhizobiaceae bacterium]|nr:NAD(P)-dependent oxidoreductase [Rhizobiaceae bacterium]
MTNEHAKRVGFVGLGKMGQPMAENLSRSPDWSVVVYDLNPRAARALEAHANWGRTLFPADRLEDFASCQIVITMLPDSRITNAVVLGDGDNRGLADILAAGSTILDMGSSDPEETVKLARHLEERGLRLIDTPVSGSVVKARSGELTIMVGAPEPETAPVQPILTWMGKTIIHTGGAGSAHAMKTLNNYVYAAGLLALSEALLIARRMELDEDVFAEIINVSSGKNFATETKLRQFMLPRTYNGGFALRLLSKDLRTADSLRKRAEVDAPQLSWCTDFANEAEAALPGDADSTELYRFIEERQKSRSKE